MERKSGFYWVRVARVSGGKRIVGEYISGAWFIAGHGAMLSVYDIIEINENRIMSPDEWE